MFSAYTASPILGNAKLVWGYRTVARFGFTYPDSLTWALTKTKVTTELRPEGNKPASLVSIKIDAAGVTNVGNRMAQRVYPVVNRTVSIGDLRDPKQG